MWKKVETKEEMDKEVREKKLRYASVKKPHELVQFVRAWNTNYVEVSADDFWKFLEGHGLTVWKSEVTGFIKIFKSPPITTNGKEVTKTTKPAKPKKAKAKKEEEKEEPETPMPTKSKTSKPTVVKQ